MNAMRTHDRSWQAGSPGSNSPDAAYLGWSHRNARMEMMDLPAYIDSYRQSYETLSQGYGGGLGGGAQPGQWYSPATATPTPARGHGRRGHQRDCDCGHGGRHEQGRGRGDEHGHGRDRDCGCGERFEGDCGCGRGHRDDRDCGCGPEPDCRCECCIEDADIVVYAHCGEVRVVPIAIENDTRKVRADVAVDVTEIRTAGGHILPWRTRVSPEGPLTLEPCSTTRLEILVQINCHDDKDQDGQAPKPAPVPAPGGDKAPAGERLRGKVQEQLPPTSVHVLDRSFGEGRGTGDLDTCVVGYFTVRLGGCVTRPIVVALAVLPDSCDSYHTSCSCSCCC